MSASLAELPPPFGRLLPFSRRFRLHFPASPPPLLSFSSTALLWPPLRPLSLIVCRRHLPPLVTCLPSSSHLPPGLPLPRSLSPLADSLCSTCLTVSRPISPRYPSHCLLPPCAMSGLNGSDDDDEQSVGAQSQSVTERHAGVFAPLVALAGLTATAHDAGLEAERRGQAKAAERALVAELVRAQAQLARMEAEDAEMVRETRELNERADRGEALLKRLTEERKLAKEGYERRVSAAEDANAAVRAKMSSPTHRRCISPRFPAPADRPHLDVVVVCGGVAVSVRWWCGVWGCAEQGGSAGGARGDAEEGASRAVDDPHARVSLTLRTGQHPHHPPTPTLH